MSTEFPPEEVVHQSALQLWAAAQTDFDPYEVPPEEWKGAVAITEADIATDTGLPPDVVRDCLKSLDGTRLVVVDNGETLSVTSIVPGDAPL